MSIDETGAQLGVQRQLRLRLLPPATLQEAPPQVDLQRRNALHEGDRNRAQMRLFTEMSLDPLE